MATVSPLAPAAVPGLPPLAGVRLATAAAGIRYAGRTDVLLALFDPGTSVAGVLTRSKCPSAPVEWCREKLKSGRARALVVNSGNANAFTGKNGREAARFTAALAARASRCKPAEVFLASTGVIGEPLKVTQFNGVMDGLAAAAKPGAWLEAAKAIMTTDTFPKLATASAALGKATVRINGFAKGAGMIAPDMATMRRRRDPARRGFRARATSGSRIFAGRCTACSPICPSRSRATAKARASLCGSR